MKAKDLTESQRKVFECEFYRIASFDDRDGSPLPWGCPWLWSNETLRGNTIIDMARNFYNYHLDEINEMLSEEIHLRDES